MTNPSTKRPGGRSTRVKAAVFDAVEALLADNPQAFPSMAEVAERSGVNITSLYRRWGDARTLLADVAVERLMREQPMPDLGSVRKDLIAWSKSIAREIGRPEGLSLLRIMAMDVRSAASDADIMSTPVGRRVAELEGVLERGRQRGEAVPGVRDVLEIVIAPLYLHALFLGPIKEPAGVARLVDRALLPAIVAGASKRSS